MSTLYSNELRAKRTHARRSCDLCKVRKTRCELPDLEIPSSSHALPGDKACHRCKVLALPCIVDDSSRKQGKRIREEAWASSRDIQASSPKRRQSQAGPSRLSDSEGIEKNNGVNHSLDLIHAFHPADTTNPDSLFAPSSAFLNTPDSKIEAESRDAQHTRSIRFHGRPLELVCAMLRVAYGKTKMRSKQQVGMDDLSLDGLVDHDMRARLEPGSVRLVSAGCY